MYISSPNQNLDSILAKPFLREVLTKGDISYLLQLRNDNDLELLFKTARDLRNIHFKNKIFLYGFLYISSYCRNNCNFCYYRVHNSTSIRYRKNESQILGAALSLAESGVHLIDLTMGEDPLFFTKKKGFEPIINIVKKIKDAVGLPIMVSSGVVPSKILKDLSNAGASWYACYQETHSPDLFNKLRPKQDFQKRLDIKYIANKHGLLTEEGILLGVGENTDDIINSFNIMGDIDADQVRGMSFVPQYGSPMEDFNPSDPLRELLVISCMRLLFPDKLIPASLDVEGLEGLKARLDAGANVVTSIVPPYSGLAGVAQNSLDIDNARRTTDKVIEVLDKLNLSVASHDLFSLWMNKRLNSKKR